MVLQLAAPPHVRCLLFFVFALYLFHHGTCERTPEEWREWEDGAALRMMRQGRQVVWYDGTITCNVPTFCAAIYYQEQDRFQTGDFLLYTGLHCTNTTVLKHSVMVLYEEGDGFHDHNYETELYIAHNCNTSGRVVMNLANKEHNIIFDVIPDTLQSYYYRKNFTINLDWPELPHTTDLTFDAYFEQHGYPEDPLNTKWRRQEHFTNEERNQLLEYRRLYQYEDNFESDGAYDVCLATAMPEVMISCKHCLPTFLSTNSKFLDFQ